MNDLMTNPAFKWFALSTVVLALNLIVLSGLTGATRAKHKSLANPEDAGFDAKVGEHPAVARVIRAHRNAVENLMPYFALGIVYVLSGASARGAMAYSITFTAARVLHSAFYLLEKQPWRTISYAIGALAMLGMMAQIVMRAVAAG